VLSSDEFKIIKEVLRAEGAELCLGDIDKVLSDRPKEEE